MRYQVPQFIEVEDRIFGPLTIKQFVYVVGGFGISFVLWKLLPIYISIFLIAPILGFSLALAFYKINNRPFIIVVESALRYVLNNKLYLWEKREPKKEKGVTIATETRKIAVPKLSESKLKDLAWSLDIKENLNPVTRDEESN
jgi:hypothetical protein